MMIARFVVPTALIIALSCARVAQTSALAQETNTQRSTDGQTTPTTTVDQAAARIKYLHDRLRITEEQEPVWDPVAQAIRESEGDLVPLRREQFRAATSGRAPDLLRADEALGNVQLDRLRKIIAVFGPLYAGMSESQKKIADAILREGAQNTMINGIPFVPPPFISSLAYPSLWIGPGLPLLVHRPAGFHHFHSPLSPGEHFGRFRH